MLSVESSTHAHAQARGGLVLPTKARIMCTEQHGALQVAGRWGSCTRKEIIETGLFMLVGKGA